MPTPTYDLISSTTLAASTTEIVFGLLPQNYRDLILVCVHGNSPGGYDTSLRFNGDTSSNYFNVYALGGGTGSPASGVQTLTFADCGYSGSSGVLLNRIIQIMDYSATDKQKITISRANGPFVGEQVTMYGNRWANTAAITSVTVFRGSGGSYPAGATFNLYGVIA